MNTSQSISKAIRDLEILDKIKNIPRLSDATQKLKSALNELEDKHQLKIPTSADEVDLFKLCTSCLEETRECMEKITIIANEITEILRGNKVSSSSNAEQFVPLNNHRIISNFQIIEEKEVVEKDPEIEELLNSQLNSDNSLRVNILSSESREQKDDRR